MRDTPLSPLTVFLSLGGCRLQASTFSEAGLTLTSSSSLQITHDELRRGRLTPATLLLCADGDCIRYSVMVRLATRSTGLVEVALAEIPAEARLRLRHASAGSAPEPRESFPLRSSASRGSTPPGGRRLALPTSAAVRAVTSQRRSLFDAPNLPSEPRAPATDQGSTLAASPAEQHGTVMLPQQVGIAIVVLALSSVFLVVIAIAYVVQG